MYYAPLDVVLCGSFTRAPEELRADVLELEVCNARVLSPLSIDFVAGHEEGFVRAAHELEASAAEIEGSHLEAIVAASFVWLHLPEGHLGRSAATELGFATGLGVPVYARALPGEPGLDWMITKVASPAAAIFDVHRRGEEPGGHGLRRLQKHYARAAARRGWSAETAAETIERLRREIVEYEAAETGEGRRLEYADIQLYVTHLGNVDGIDADAAVAEKERLNTVRFG